MQRKHVVMLAAAVIASGGALAIWQWDERTRVAEGTAATAGQDVSAAAESEGTSGSGAASEPVPLETAAGGSDDGTAHGGGAAGEEHPVGEQVAARPEGAGAGGSDVSSASSDTSSSSVGSNGAGADDGQASPSFDVARIERSGEAVIAGRAEPGSEIVLETNEGEVGRATADRAGAWVIIPRAPFKAGDHEVGITERTKDGRTKRSKEVLVVSIPREREAETFAARSGEDSGGSVREARREPPQAASPDIQESLEAGEKQVASRPEANAAGQQAEDAPRALGMAPSVAGRVPSPPGKEALAVILERGGGGARIMQQSEESERTGLRQGELVLDSVDYDEKGTAIIGGRAPKDSKVVLYVDNHPVGTATADQEGRWEITPQAPFKKGLQTLRVDQVGGGGNVVARVETPFSRADPVNRLPVGQYVIVQPGNSLWRIARRTYGDGLRYTVIYETNDDQIRNPDLIYPGQIFEIPQQG